MKQMTYDPSTAAIIAAAWADEISVERIKNESGLSENEVKAIMRKHLKRGSYIVWRKRVVGRVSKHEKKAKFIFEQKECNV